jgi:hypothetical protein
VACEGVQEGGGWDGFGKLGGRKEGVGGRVVDGGVGWAGGEAFGCSWEGVWLLTWELRSLYCSEAW